MCYGEEIQYRCGHVSVPVVRPCALTTSGHNNPICHIQLTYEYRSETMCVPCERVLHSRWTLLQEWEHRWYHERGVCPCEVNFPDLGASHPRATGIDNSPVPKNVRRSSHPVNDVFEMNKLGSCQVQSEPDKVNYTTQLISKDCTQQRHFKGPVAVGGTPTQSREAHIPARYEEKTDGDKTQVTVRQPSQYAAEWLEDHRALHISGQCHCNTSTKPMRRSESFGCMNAVEERVLELHHRITGDGSNPKEWTPPSEADIIIWRNETGVPELGTLPRYTCVTRRSPATVEYPVPLGNNMYMTEHFVIWDAELLAARVKAMQITDTDGNGLSSSITIPNGRRAAQELAYYQPDAISGSHRVRKRGYRQHSYRNWKRRDTRESLQSADPFGHGSPVDINAHWQQRSRQAPISMQELSQDAQYDYLALPQVPHSTPYSTPPPARQQSGLSVSGDVGQQREFHDDDAGITPTAIHAVQGTNHALGGYQLTPPDSHVSKSMTSRSSSTPSSDMDQVTPTPVPSKAGNNSCQTTPVTPATPAIVNGTRQPANQCEPGEPTDQGKDASSGASTSVAPTPCQKRKRTVARRLKTKQNKEEEKERQKKLLAAKDDDGGLLGEEQQQQQRCSDVKPYCGLPIGAGPESSMPHMPTFENCSLFYPVATRHRRTSSCPSFPDTQPLSYSSRD